MSNCELCGEPMQEAESMFKYHGSLGPCPKPPLPKPTVEAVVEYLHRETDGEYWIDVNVNRAPYAQIGPFETTTERKRAHDDMLNMLRSAGAKDLPVHHQ
jgi:hypothetical protein